MKQIKLFAICLLLAQISFAQKVDFSIVSVPEESGIDFVKITQDGDYVCMPQVKRSSTGASWNTSHILDISKDGQNIAYLSQRNKTTNIFFLGARQARKFYSENHTHCHYGFLIFS